MIVVIAVVAVLGNWGEASRSAVWRVTAIVVAAGHERHLCRWTVAVAAKPLDLGGHVAIRDLKLSDIIHSYQINGQTRANPTSG